MCIYVAARQKLSDSPTRNIYHPFLPQLRIVDLWILFRGSHNLSHASRAPRTARWHWLSRKRLFGSIAFAAAKQRKQKLEHRICRMPKLYKVGGTLAYVSRIGPQP